jgi:hypothetical protein
MNIFCNLAFLLVLIGAAGLCQGFSGNNIEIQDVIDNPDNENRCTGKLKLYPYDFEIEPIE